MVECKSNPEFKPEIEVEKYLESKAISESRRVLLREAFLQGAEYGYKIGYKTAQPPDDPKN